MVSAGASIPSRPDCGSINRETPDFISNVYLYYSLRVKFYDITTTCMSGMPGEEIPQATAPRFLHALGEKKFRPNLQDGFSLKVFFHWAYASDGG